MNENNPGPLAGLLVVELAGVLAGPSVGMFLAELGARVIKIEPPDGDVTRSWRVAGEAPTDGRSAYFTAMNWGKEFVTLNLKAEPDWQLFLRILALADVLLTAYRPSDALGERVKKAALARTSSGLVVGEISGYGPAVEQAGYDAIVQAETGFVSMNGEAGHEGHKMPVALMDVLAAHQLKQGILVALLQKAATGKGQAVAVSLMDAGLAALANQATNWLVAGYLPQPEGSSHPNIVPYGTAFALADGRQVVLAVGTDKQFEALCSILGIALVAGWATNAGRVAHRTAVDGAIAHALARWESGTFLAECLQAHIPAGQVNTVAQALQTPAALPMLLHAEGVQALRTAVFASPLELRAPQPIGADNARLRAEFREN